ncbi:MAG: alpha/beta fold hydrolase [Deltaproteobacteria bacterium]|nr:alpha/beta fold hydrolase [Deltaproteobacteria bacterium]
MSTAAINGTDLYYVTIGDGLPCLVMHGGLGFDHTILHPWLDPLEDTFHLIYYDHRGNGRSGRPTKETMTHTQLTSDAEAFALHLGFDQVAVIGFSYGGFIALEFALRYPHRVSHLILLDTAPVFNYAEEIMENARRQGATDEMLDVLQEDWLSDREMRESLVENCIISVAGQTLEGEIEAYNVIPRLGEIHIPTLILVGRHDFVCPPIQAHIMHEGIDNSELVIFEKSGHLPYIEEADAFFKTVRDWIKRTS